MLDSRVIYDALRDVGVSFFAGVPDSLLKDFCFYLTDHADDSSHVITANEGSAVALAAGYHLATGNLGLVYMQNSGQGNAVNPLVSLADPDVYGIPMLLLIGWRGEPGRHDEPQHVKQGKLTLRLLSCLGIEHGVLPGTPEEAVAAVRKAVERARHESAPYALVVRQATFARYELRNSPANAYSLSREDAIKMLVDHLPESAAVVATTGKASRELFEYRAQMGDEPGRDFLTVGSMGHASQIALGVAFAQPGRPVYCLDGDGAAIMHLGSWATIGSRGPANFKHVLLNNGAHESVGGQPTAGLDIDFTAIARACGYRGAARATNRDELDAELDRFIRTEGPFLLEIRTKLGARADLGRPTTTPAGNKEAFMRRLRS